LPADITTTTERKTNFPRLQTLVCDPNRVRFEPGRGAGRGTDKLAGFRSIPSFRSRGGTDADGKLFFPRPEISISWRRLAEKKLFLSDSNTFRIKSDLR